MGKLVEPMPEAFRRAQAGDKAACERIFKFYEAYIRTTCRLFYRPGRSDLEDHFGEGYIAFLTALKYYDPAKNDSFAGYMRVILTRRLMDLNKRNQRRFDGLVFLDDEIVDLEEDGWFAVECPDDRYVGERTEMVQALLTSADDRVRRAVSLIAIERLDAREAAGVVGLRYSELVWLIRREMRTWNAPIITTTAAIVIPEVLIMVMPLFESQQLSLFEGDAA